MPKLFKLNQLLIVNKDNRLGTNKGTHLTWECQKKMSYFQDKKTESCQVIHRDRRATIKRKIMVLIEFVKTEILLQRFFLFSTK